MTIIRVHNLVKRYQHGANVIEALRGVSLEVQSGEFVAVTGPSGSGKSTLIHIIGCLDRPTYGTYEFCGMPVEHLDDDKLAAVRNQKIGFVFQSFNLLPRLPAWKNVALPLLYAGVARRERKQLALEALHLVGLSDRVGHRPNELSGGQQQRVAIARALVNHPTLILADEPTGNLDSHVGMEVMKVFQELNQLRGVTIMLVTHDPHIAAYCQRRLGLEDGKIITDDLA
ncbi:MAG TPA: ABC transporter ATP-binding protein [Alphaproteobacteria bacterium]|nr:ABC transporter ATP-binding protein [Alphaproteobacteria bacterium]